jgi:SAM-dependent methyltransferase
MPDHVRHRAARKTRAPRDGEPAELPWTGERLVASARGDFVAEHLHRYSLAVEFAKEADVLDVACGAGYGSAFLAKVARRVIGVDCDAPTVSFASRNYRARNLRFLEGRAEKLPIPSGSVDLVVSFETLEHLKDHGAAMREIKRVLRPGGRLLISTPDRKPYREASGKLNPFHVRELELKSFGTLLSKHFKNVTMGYQKTATGSWIAPFDSLPSASFEYSGDFSATRRVTAGSNAPYLIAFASDSSVPSLPASLFNSTQELQASLRALEKDRAELTVWAQTLEAEIRKANEALSEQAALLAERTAWAKSLETELRSTQSSFAQLNEEYVKRTAWAQNLEAQLQQARVAHAEQTNLVAERTAWAQALEADLTKAHEVLTEQAALLSERTAWAQSLEAELQSAQSSVAELNKEHGKRAASVEALEVQLKSAHAAMAEQGQLDAERTGLVKSLERELIATRESVSALRQQSDEHSRCVRLLEADLDKERTSLVASCKLSDERSAWARSLEIDISEIRLALNEQINIISERTARAQALEAELKAALDDRSRLQQDLEQRDGWANQLEADLKGIQASHAQLELTSELVRLTLDHLAGLIIDPGRLSESDRVHFEQPDGSEVTSDSTTTPSEAALIEQCAGILADLHGDIAENAAAARDARGVAVEARIRAESAESLVRELTCALENAQGEVDLLLDRERLHAQRELEFSSEVLSLRRQLDRYESNTACRLIARAIDNFRSHST